MIQYDRSEPLIAIHIPKTGGSTARRIFEDWYGNGFLRHYFSKTPDDQLPSQYDLSSKHSTEHPVLLYGHFNRSRKFGVEDYYPEVNQFVTILRDPFEMAVSAYFFALKRGKKRDGDIAQHLLDLESLNMLNHFPRVVTKENYKEIIEKYFIEVGITEYFHESMRRIAHKLGFSCDSNPIAHLNATERNTQIPENLREIFRENHPLEFDVYAYALHRFKQRNEIP